jgi:hypothetical protein
MNFYFGDKVRHIMATYKGASKHHRADIGDEGVVLEHFRKGSGFHVKVKMLTGKSTGRDLYFFPDYLEKAE